MLGDDAQDDRTAILSDARDIVVAQTAANPSVEPLLGFREQLAQLTDSGIIGTLYGNITVSPAKPGDKYGFTVIRC